MRKDIMTITGNNRVNIYIYGHNSNKFDTLFLQEHIVALFGSQMERIGTSSSIKYMKIADFYIFRDMIQLLPGSLKQLCKDFKTQNQKLEFEAGKIDEARLQHDQEYKNKLIEYCEYDVKILKQLYYAFFNKVKEILPQFKEKDIKSTLPSTALHIFTKFYFDIEYNNGPLYGNYPNKDGIFVQELERQSYFGGYTQVFNHSTGKNLKYFDFVSMYVSILISTQIPYSQGVFHRAQKIYQKNELYHEIFDTATLYQIESFSFSYDTIISNLPVREQKSKVTVYPRSYKKGDAGNEFIMLWGDELNIAVQLGLEYIEISGFISYDKFSDCFSKYMKDWFDLKKKSKQTHDDALAQVAKLFGNSLYGKTGQRQEGRRFYIQHDELQNLTLEEVSDIYLKPKSKDILEAYVQQNEKKFNQPVKHIKPLNDSITEIEFIPDISDLNYSGSLVRIASFTTMTGRCWLMKKILQVGQENVFYCDTDSLVFKQEFLDKIPKQEIGDDFCQIADQFPNINIIEAEFIAAKNYYCLLDSEYKGSKQYVKFKGVKNPTIDMIKNLRKEGSGKIEQQQWKRQWEGVGIRDIVKNIVLRTKRKVYEDGSSYPFQNYAEFEKFNNKKLTKINNKLTYSNL